MTNKIKPCPSCGSRAKYAAGGNVPGFVIGCTNEKCHEFILQQTAHHDEVMDAIEAWNNRVECTCQQVVRCKDCYFSIAHGNGCARNEDIYDVEPDGFCAWGERLVD